MVKELPDWHHGFLANPPWLRPLEERKQAWWWDDQIEAVILKIRRIVGL
jgi:hypothetical protein